jgi:hypothetical protein
VPANLSLRRLTALLAGAVVLPLVLAACSSSSTTGSTTTTGATGVTGPTGVTGKQRVDSVCSLVPAVQIELTLGKLVDAPRVANANRLTVCTYLAKIPADTVIVGFRAKVSQADAGLEQAQLGKLHGTLTDVSGPGFSAYYFSDPAVRPAVIGLVTINGQTQITVTSTAPLAKQELLTQQIFATLAARATGASTTTSTSTTTSP